MYNLIPPLILIVSLAGLIILFVKKFAQISESFPEEKEKLPPTGELNKNELRVFGLQKHVLLVVERVLGIFVASTMKIAGASSRLLGRVRIRSREIHKASDFAKHYFEKIRSKKSRARLSREEEECIELIKADPANTEAYKKLGDIYFSKGSYGDAKLSLEQVLRLKPDDEETKARLEEIEDILKGRESE